MRLADALHVREHGRGREGRRLGRQLVADGRFRLDRPDHRRPRHHPGMVRSRCGNDARRRFQRARRSASRAGRGGCRRSSSRPPPSRRRVQPRVGERVDLHRVLQPLPPRRMDGRGDEAHPGHHPRLGLRIVQRQQPRLGIPPRQVVEDAGDLGQRAARRSAASAPCPRDSPPGSRPSAFRSCANDTGTASNGAPTSLSAICGAIELAPGAKYSVSIRLTSLDPAHRANVGTQAALCAKPDRSQKSATKKRTNQESSLCVLFVFFSGLRVQPFPAFGCAPGRSTPPPSASARHSATAAGSGGRRRPVRGRGRSSRRRGRWRTRR